MHQVFYSFVSRDPPNLDVMATSHTRLWLNSSASSRILLLVCSDLLWSAGFTEETTDRVRHVNP